VIFDPRESYIEGFQMRMYTFGIRKEIRRMSHTFRVSEEQYADLAAYAERINETPEWVFQAWVQGIADWVEIQKSASRKQTNTNCTFQVPEEQYVKLMLCAKEHNTTPEEIFRTWVQNMTNKEIYSKMTDRSGEERRI